MSVDLSVSYNYSAKNALNYKACIKIYTGSMLCISIDTVQAYSPILSGPSPGKVAWVSFLYTIELLFQKEVLLFLFPHQTVQAFQTNPYP